MLGAISALALAVSAQPAHADGAIRTVLVIDASSSMRRTDPNDLRKVAAELFVDLARSGDEIAVTGFDERARQASGRFVTISGADSRRALKQAIRAIGDDGQWTDFTAGLGEAARLFEAEPGDPGDQALVLFLTDGKCEPDPEGPLAASERPTEREAACQQAVLDDLTTALDGARVFAIGLSKGAPAAFLDELGRRTGGRGLVTLDPRQLPRLFANVYADLLGSRLREGAGRKRAEFDIVDGAASLDLMIVGPTPSTEQVFDPSGREIAIDNRAPDQIYFAGSDEYRLYKIAAPEAGQWAIAFPGPRPRQYATLQHFDITLALIDPPAVVELGDPLHIKAAVRLGAGNDAPAALLARHRLSATVQRQVSAGDALEPITLELTPQPDGSFAGRLDPEHMGELAISLALEPGAGGMIERTSDELARIAVIPPIHLVAKPLALGAHKQGVTLDATLDMSGSQLGAALEFDLRIADPAAAGAPNTVTSTDDNTGAGDDDDGQPQTLPWLSLEPARSTLSPDQERDAVERTLALTFAIADDAPVGPAQLTVTLTPKPPPGFPGDFSDRVVTIPLTVDVQALSFWERYGRLIQYAAGALAALILLCGWLLPARFKKRVIVYYKDIRDPDLVRQSSYPAGVKARPGLFRGARLRLGPTGPVKRGGAVELRAAAGGAIEAIPLHKGTVYKTDVSREDDGFGVPHDKDNEHRARVTLRDNRFRLAPGTGYEIEGSGVVFWYR
ncbi:MAG: hypothetical protein Tsb0020_43570 [Haliangiales bacterium]